MPWKDITRYNSAWNTLVNLATLVVMANGLTRSGFIDWFAGTMSTHLEGFSPNATVIVLVLVFYFAPLPVCQPVCAHRNHAAGYSGRR
nr:citrate succinate antiporter [uncultured bacterium]